MALNLTDTKKLHDQIQRDRADASKNPADGDEGEKAVKLYRDYAAGKQGCTLTEALASILEGATKHMFSDNKCHPVISEAADRIVLLRYDVDPPGILPGAADVPEQAAKQAEEVKNWIQREIWVKCALSDLSGFTNYATFRDANFCLLPTWSEIEQRVVIHKELWWDGESGMFVMYDEWGRPEYAVKEWMETDEEDRQRQRRTVYLDDQIRRYARPNGAGDWEPFQLEGDTQWPMPWVKRDGTPLHIPVVHFQNGGRGEVASELAGGFIGQQDSLNDKRYDMDVASRMTAYQMYWVKGKPALERPGAERKRPTVGPGTVWQVGEDGAAGVLPAGSMAELESAYNLIVRSMSQTTRTPMHVLLGADPPSGEALLRAELPAVNKATRQREKLAPSYATLAHRCVEISNAFGTTALNEDAMIRPVFAPVTQLGELQRAMADAAFWDAANKAVTAGYPLSLFLAEHDYTPEQIAKLEEEQKKQEQSAQDEEERTLERMMQNVDMAST
jgi:hypothetical protein